jgi:hypothetical protein
MRNGTYSVWTGRRFRRRVDLFPIDAGDDARRLFVDLESAATRRSGRRRTRLKRWGRRVTVGVVVVAIGASIGAVLGFLQGSRGVDRTPDTVGPLPTQTARYVDGTGAFSVRVPPGWTAEPRAVGGTQLVETVGGVSITIEAMPSGDLEANLRTAVSSFTAAWDDVALEPQAAREIGDRQGIIQGGTATAAGGSSFRFLAIVVAGPADRDLALLVRVPPDWDPVSGFTEIEQIVSSLRQA